MAYRAFNPNKFYGKEINKSKLFNLKRKVLYQKKTKRIKNNNISLPIINENKNNIKKNLLNYSIINKNRYLCHSCHKRECNCEIQNGTLFNKNKKSVYNNEYNNLYAELNKYFHKNKISNKNIHFKKPLITKISDAKDSYRIPNMKLRYDINFKKKWGNSKNIQKVLNYLPFIQNNSTINLNNHYNWNNSCNNKNILIDNSKKTFVPSLKYKESEKYGCWVNSNKIIDSKNLYYRNKLYYSDPISRNIKLN